MAAATRGWLGIRRGDVYSVRQEPSDRVRSNVQLGHTRFDLIKGQDFSPQLLDDLRSRLYFKQMCPFSFGTKLTLSLVPLYDWTFIFCARLRKNYMEVIVFRDLGLWIN